MKLKAPDTISYLSLERDVAAKWQELEKDRDLILEVRMVVATALK